MKHRTPWTIRALSLLMSALFLFACSETPAPEEDPKPAEASETPADTAETAGETVSEEPQITRANYPDSLPEEMDFAGAEYRIMCPESTDLSSLSATNEMVTDELTGEIVNDAIYNRALSVMNRLKVNVGKVVVADTASALRNNISAGDNACEIAACYAYYISPLALTGSFYDWLGISRIDLEQPWWPATLSQDLVIDNSLYFISGDISLKLLQYTYCMFFNKSLAADWNVPDLYDLVLEGKWTLDQYIEVTSAVSQDLDGDGKYTDSDLYGTMNNLYCDVRYACYDIPLSGRDENGFLTLDVMSEKFVNVYSRLYEYYHTSNSVTRFVDKMPAVNLFMQDRLLILPYLIVCAENMRDMENDYGIIPYPKYDEAQEAYCTNAHDNYSLMCIPITVPQDSLEMVGAATEAMAAESYRTVTSAYLEVAMKDKFLRDENSQNMLDIITSGIKFDPINIYSNCIADLAHIWREIYNGTEDITSWYKSKEKVYQKALERFNKDYAEIDE